MWQMPVLLWVGLHVCVHMRATGWCLVFSQWLPAFLLGTGRRIIDVLECDACACVVCPQAHWCFCLFVSITGLSCPVAVSVPRHHFGSCHDCRRWHFSSLGKWKLPVCNLFVFLFLFSILIPKITMPFLSIAHFFCIFIVFSQTFSRRFKFT